MVTLMTLQIRCSNFLAFFLTVLFMAAVADGVLATAISIIAHCTHPYVIIFCKLNIFASPENNIPPVYVCRIPLVISLLLSLHSSRLLRFHLIECWQLLYISFFWELYETLNHIDSLLHTDLVPSGFFFVFLLGHLFLLLAISFWLLFDNLLCLHHFSFVYQKVRFLV